MLSWTQFHHKLLVRKESKHERESKHVAYVAFLASCFPLNVKKKIMINTHKVSIDSFSKRYKLKREGRKEGKGVEICSLSRFLFSFLFR